MRLNNNLSSLNASRHIGINNSKKAKSLRKLSSGYNVDVASDDVVNLSVSNKIKAQVRSLNYTERNVQEASSMIDVADGFLEEISEKLQRIRELSVYAANDTNELGDRQKIKDEINQLISDIDEISKSAEFNKMKLFDGNGIANILVESQKYITVTPKEPAWIFASEAFLATEISYGTASELSSADMNGITVNGVSIAKGATNLNALNGSPASFPREGVFVINVTNPDANNGNGVSVVLDFGQENASGNFDLGGFKTFFQTALSGIANFDVDSAGNILVDTDINGTGDHLNNKLASVTIGATALHSTVIPSGTTLTSSTRYVNSSIFGALAYDSESQYTGVKSTRELDAAEVSQINSDGVGDSTLFWSVIPDSTIFSFNLQEQYTTTEPVWDSTAGKYVDREVTRYRNINDPSLPVTFTKGQLDGMGFKTVNEANAYLSTMNDQSQQYFSGYSISMGYSVDRDGYIYASVGGSATVKPAYSNSNLYPKSMSYSPSSNYYNAKSASSNVTSAYAAGVSEKTGLLTITIGDIPDGSGGFKSASVTVDFSDKSSWPAGVAGDLDKMLAYINNELNDSANWPQPSPAFTNNGYDASYPVAKVTIDGNGKLKITAAENCFNITVEEQKSDIPMFARSSYTVNGETWNNTLQITDDAGKNTNIPIAAGDYKNIDDFISKNEASFQNNGWLLSKSDNGASLVVRSIGEGKEYTVNSLEFNRTSQTNAKAPVVGVLDNLGFVDQTQQLKLIDGITHTSYQKELDQRALWAESAPKDYWIQSGSNSNQGTLLRLPHINAEILGLIPGSSVTGRSAGYLLSYDDELVGGTGTLIKDLQDTIASKSLTLEGMSALTDDNPSKAALKAEINALRGQIAKIEEQSQVVTTTEVFTHDKAGDTIKTIDNALRIVTQERTVLGVAGSRLEHARQSLIVANENMSDTASRLRDVDVAKEMSVLVRNQIIGESANSALAQANQSANSVLQLIGK